MGVYVVFPEKAGIDLPSVKCRRQINNWAESCWADFSRFLMVNGEYTVDWRFCDRAPLCTQAYSGRYFLRQSPQNSTGESTHTRMSFRGGSQVFSQPSKTSFSNHPSTPSPLTPPPPIPARIGFLSLTKIQYHRILIMEY